MTCFKKISSIFWAVAVSFMIGFAYAQYNPDQYDQDGVDMRERCRKEGAINVVDELLKYNQREWEDVLEKIASGNSQWIDASACLSHGVYYGLNLLSDYADATLADAWAQALLKNPKDLLRRDREISLTVLCGLPLDYRDKSVEFADKFLANALAALEIAEEDSDYYKRNKKTCAFHLKLDHERFMKQLNEYKQGH